MPNIPIGCLSCESHFQNNENDSIMKSIISEQEQIGYYHLPDSSIREILSFAKNDNHKEIVVIGIGGSSLGTKAVYNFLKNSITSSFRPLHFLESTDPISLLANISEIDQENALFLVISKSGNTTETMSIFKYILSLGLVKKSSLVVVTDEHSPLHRYAISEKIHAFHLPSNVGGRFSVLSAVGLLPLALAGVDINDLLIGAKSVKDSFFHDASCRDYLISKANFYGKNYKKYSINTLFSYANGLKHFNEWYVQLWGESLGKKHITLGNIGLTPVGIIGPVDQHSFLQLVAEGPRDKTMTFIKIRDFGVDIKVPEISLTHLESLDIFHSLSFGNLINMQADSIIEQLSALQIPLDIIELSCIDAKNIGALIFYFELLTSLTGVVMEINPYDQPGVEDGKKILKRNILSIKNISQ